MSSTPSHTIVGRMRDCLERQIDWYQELIGELTQASQLLATTEVSDEEAAKLEENMSAFARKSMELQDEFRALKNEWDGAENIPNSEREDVKALSARVQALSTELANLYTQNSELAQKSALSSRAELSTMQRLSTSMLKYRTDGGDSTSFLDKKA